MRGISADKTKERSFIATTPSEIVIHIFESLSSIYDAERLGQTPSRLYDYWKEHSKLIIDDIIQKNIEGPKEAGTLARYQMDLIPSRRQSTSHVMSIQYARNIFISDLLAQQAVERLYMDTSRKPFDIYSRPHLSEHERQDIVKAFYRALVTALTLFTHIREPHSKLPKLFAYWSAKELEETLTVLWWFFRLRLWITFDSQIFSLLGYTPFSYRGSMEDRLFGFQKAHLESFNGEILSDLCDHDRFFKISDQFGASGSGDGRRLVAETFKGMVVKSSGGSENWWEKPGVWDNDVSFKQCFNFTCDVVGIPLMIRRSLSEKNEIHWT